MTWDYFLYRSMFFLFDASIGIGPGVVIWPVFLGLPTTLGPTRPIKT